jgi:hypothetical protein
MRVITAIAALAISGSFLVGLSGARMDSAPATSAPSPAAQPDAGAATSTIWAGYVVQKGKYSSVSASWAQPAVKAGTAPAYAYLWAGLDGWSSRVKDTIEQVGTGAERPHTFSDAPVSPGDQFASTVTYGSGHFTLTLTDATQHWTHSVTESGSAYRTSAEVIAEAPTNVLANFGTATFHGITVNGSPMRNPFPVTLKVGRVLATVSAFRNSGFTAAWRHTS